MCYGSEFTAKAVRAWLSRIGVKTLYIEAGSPWEDGCNASFNGKLGDELLKREDFIPPQGGQGTDRAAASSLRHHPASQRARVPAASAAGHPAPPRRSVLRSGWAEDRSTLPPTCEVSKLKSGTSPGGAGQSSGPANRSELKMPAVCSSAPYPALKALAVALP